MATREPASVGRNNPASRVEGAVVSTKSIENFLRNYSPEDRAFTSVDEMMRVRDRLNLDNLDRAGLTEMRNRVVRFYRDLMDKERAANGWSDKFDSYSQGMMSVTAIIDYMYNRAR